MMASIDYRHRVPQVTLRMTLVEFRETVEWLETLDPSDGATQDWRAELDHVDPPEFNGRLERTSMAILWASGR